MELQLRTASAFFLGCRRQFIEVPKPPQTTPNGLAAELYGENFHIIRLCDWRAGTTDIPKAEEDWPELPLNLLSRGEMAIPGSLWHYGGRGYRL